MWKCWARQKSQKTRIHKQLCLSGILLISTELNQILPGPFPSLGDSFHHPLAESQFAPANHLNPSWTPEWSFPDCAQWIPKERKKFLPLLLPLSFLCSSHLLAELWVQLEHVSKIILQSWHQLKLR